MIESTEVAEVRASHERPKNTRLVEAGRIGMSRRWAKAREDAEEAARHRVRVAQLERFNKKLIDVLAKSGMSQADLLNLLREAV